MEGIYVARRGIADMDAIQAMFGASLVGLLLSGVVFGAVTPRSS